MDPESENQPSESPDGDFKSSLHALVTARITLMRHELKQLLRDRARALTSVLVAAMLIFFTWALLLTGLIAAIALSTGWPWHLVTLAFAALHLMAAIILVKSAASTVKNEPFPITRSEFKKDCEWLESLQNKPKSKS